MIVITQTGQAGHTKLLFDMHRLRKEVFSDRMKWPVRVDALGLETDQFDLPETVYFLALDNFQRVIGTWRLLPSSGPTMIREIWPQFTRTLPLPHDITAWEISRFAVKNPQDTDENYRNQIHQATAELFCSMAEVALLCGIQEVYTLHDMRIARLLNRLDCNPVGTSEILEIDGIAARVGKFITDHEMLARLRTATGIHHSLIGESPLPPALEVLRTTPSLHTVMPPHEIHSTGDFKSC